MHIEWPRVGRIDVVDMMDPCVLIFRLYVEAFDSPFSSSVAECPLAYASMTAAIVVVFRRVQFALFLSSFLNVMKLLTYPREAGV